MYQVAQLRGNAGHQAVGWNYAAAASCERGKLLEPLGPAYGGNERSP